MPHKIASHIVFVALSILSLGCSSAAPDLGKNGFVDSPYVVEELATFIVVGQTERNEIIERLGPPYLSSELENGISTVIYLWESDFSYLNSDGKVRAISYDEYTDHHCDRKSAGATDKVLLLLYYEENGLVISKEIECS